jgi:hypothetical protein
MHPPSKESPLGERNASLRGAAADGVLISLASQQAAKPKL